MDTIDRALTLETKLHDRACGYLKDAERVANYLRNRPAAEIDYDSIALALVAANADPCHATYQVLAEALLAGVYAEAHADAEEWIDVWDVA